jgi:CubicO group peptidase (beta-lactamase class C family)
MKRRNFLSTLTAAGVGHAFTPAIVNAKTSRGVHSRSSKVNLDTILAVTEVPAMAVAGVVRGKPLRLLAGLRVALPDPPPGMIVSTPRDRPGIPIEPDTYFPAASLTKPVFAWAVRDLIRQEKMELRKPLQDYADLGLSGEAKRITAEFVLTHSSGLPNWRFQLDKPLVAEFMPGSSWQYSGEGIFLLQRVVEKIVGVPIGTYMKEHVLKPLGMTASTFAWSPELQTKAASGHDRRAHLLERSSAFYEKRNYDVITRGGLQPESSTYEQILGAYEKAKALPLPVAISPNMAGSLWTTAVDYPKFLRAVLSEIPRYEDDYHLRHRINPKIGWSLGWGVDETFRRPSWFHWGDGPGFKNFAWVQPDTQTAIVFFTNGDHGQAAYSWAFRALTLTDPASVSWI